MIYENAIAAEHAEIITRELVEHYIPRMAEIGCDSSVPVAMLLVEDPRSDYMPVRFETFSLDMREVVAAYRATL